MSLLVTWTHANIVGVQAMDDEHAFMMDAMNELRAALVSGAGRALAIDLMNKLIELTRMHFRNEEHLLERFGFPGLAQHSAEHERLLAQLQESFHRLQQAETVSMGELLPARLVSRPRRGPGPAVWPMAECAGCELGL